MKLKAAYETDVSLNGEGYCVIEQDGGENCVWLTYEQTKALVRELEEMLTRQSWNSAISKGE